MIDNLAFKLLVPLHISDNNITARTELQGCECVGLQYLKLTRLGCHSQSTLPSFEEEENMKLRPLFWL